MQKLLTMGILEVPPIRNEDMLVIDVTVIETPACFMARPILVATGFPLSNTDKLSKACHTIKRGICLIVAKMC